jgi:hypothetical protein
MKHTTLLLLGILALGCDRKAKFYCLSAGNDVARECLESQSRCEKGWNGALSRACFTVDQAYCFSVNALGPRTEEGIKTTGDRANVCTPTEEECKAFVADYAKLDAGNPPSMQRQPSGCTLATHDEIWPS